MLLPAIEDKLKREKEEYLKREKLLYLPDLLEPIPDKPKSDEKRVIIIQLT